MARLRRSAGVDRFAKGAPKDKGKTRKDKGSHDDSDDSTSVTRVDEAPTSRSALGGSAGRSTSRSTVSQESKDFNVEAGGVAKARRECSPCVCGFFVGVLRMNRFDFFGLNDTKWQA